MADNPQNVRLACGFIDGITHRFAVDGQAFIVFGELRVPTLQGTVETIWIDSDQGLSKGRAGRYWAHPLAAATAKTVPVLWGLNSAPSH